jgi:hypothetical protein
VPPLAACPSGLRSLAGPLRSPASSLRHVGSRFTLRATSAVLMVGSTSVAAMAVQVRGGAPPGQAARVRFYSAEVCRTGSSVTLGGAALQDRRRSAAVGSGGTLYDM